jgi:hypothetical protein
LKSFLRDNELEMSDIYSNNRSWTSYKRDINLPVAPAGPREDELNRRMGSILHVNDPNALSAWTTVLTTGEIDPARVQMLAYQLLHKPSDVVDPESFVSMLQEHPALRDELKEIVEVLREETVVEARQLPGVPETWPLTLHARYERREIQTAVGHLTVQRSPSIPRRLPPCRKRRLNCYL